jgi:hypothetical protein
MIIKKMEFSIDRDYRPTVLILADVQKALNRAL